MDLSERLNRHHPRVIDLSLDRILRLLDKLGRPQSQLTNVIHVAGTNGKGSAIAFMKAIAEAAGLRVNVYTSPHLIRFNERIHLDGKDIDDGSLLSLIDECEAANGDDPITFFEITTAIALLAFARRPADLTLLETGLGGRLDATNVIDRPVATLLTPISMDHMAFLGNELAGIAREKAAILKPGVPGVSSVQPSEAKEVIENRAAETGVKVSWQNRDWRSGMDNGRFLFESGAGTFRADPPVLPGAHQLQNAGMAVATLLTAIPGRLTERAVSAGLQRARWPARLQVLSDHPLMGLLPAGWELWLDGGHNPGAGEVLAGWAKGLKDKPLHLIAGFINTKDLTGFLAPLASNAASLTALRIPEEENAVPAAEIMTAGAGLGMAVHEAADVAKALEDLADREPTAARVLICGSLYLAGHVLAAASG